MRRDVYSEILRLYGEEHAETLIDTYNYADNLLRLLRFKEAKSLLRKTMPLAPRVLGESNEVTLRMRSIYATAHCQDPDATLDDLREAVETFEEIERIARRVLGGAHPLTLRAESNLRNARAALERVSPDNAVDASS